METEFSDWEISKIDSVAKNKSTDPIFRRSKEKLDLWNSIALWSDVYRKYSPS